MPSILNISAYLFTPIADPAVLRPVLRERAVASGLMGTILLAEEGINLFLAGDAAAVHEFVDVLRADERPTIVDMDSRPMQPPALQPLGFWTARAGEAIRARTRGALAELGVTQPEWWVLHQLSLHPGGIDRAVVVDTVGPNETPEAIEEAIKSARDQGWLLSEENELRLSEAGSELFTRLSAMQDDLQAERMQGIEDEDFVTTITVLQRTIDNVGGSAWHW